MRAANPLFTVIVPTFRRPDALAVCLAAWERQTPSEIPFEVIVIDDGSGDDTRDLLASWRSERFALLRFGQENQGPAIARNRGVAEARGRWVLFAGDDIEPSPDLLARHQDGHRLHPGDDVAILGQTRWAPNTPTTRTMLHVDGPGAQQFGFHWMQNDREYDFRHLYTSNVSLSRKLLLTESGPFATDFPAAAWEDAELGYRLSRGGLRIVYRANALAFHHHEYRVESFFRRQVICGRTALVLASHWPALSEWARLDQLSRVRLSLRGESPARRACLDGLAVDLKTFVQAARAIAALHDPIAESPDQILDPYLVALMEYAFLQGAAEAWFDNEDAPRAMARLFATQLLPAAIEMLDHLEEAERPCGPAADRNRLRDLAETISAASS